MKLHIMSICLLMGVSALQSFGTPGLSKNRDIGGSPADVTKAFYVVFLTQEDAKVHKGECPSTNMPVNRNCPGLKDLSQLSKSDYEAGLRKAILTTRPGGASSTPANPALAKILEDKITRINSKLSAGGLSDAERTYLQSQLADLNTELLAAKGSALTADEQKRYDLIMQKLNYDYIDYVIFDEGETNYQLALAPFGESALGMSFVKIPAGTFMMGSYPCKYYSECPQHKVTISKGFDLQTTEVTQSQWVSVMGSNPSRFKVKENCPGEFTTINKVPMCPNNPVESVSWDDAQEFISKLNAKGDGYRYRLPTEAEWEYAARAGTTGDFAGDLHDMAWYDDGYSGSMSHPVAKKQANAWGLFDMHGNVYEWTADWFDSYPFSSVTDPVGPSSGDSRVARGGSWAVAAAACSSAYRAYYLPNENRYSDLGFRLLRISP